MIRYYWLSFVKIFFFVVTTPLQIAWVLIFWIAMLLHPLYTIDILDRTTHFLSAMSKKEGTDVTDKPT
jgi:hypothetical protein